MCEAMRNQAEENTSDVRDAFLNHPSLTLSVRHWNGWSGCTELLKFNVKLDKRIVVQIVWFHLCAK